MTDAFYIVVIILLVSLLVYQFWNKTTIKTKEVDKKVENFSSAQEPLGRNLDMSPTVLGSYATPEVEEITRYDSIIVPESYNTFDELNARRIAKNQQLAKRSIDGIVRHTKNSYAKYFQEELDNNENQDWWSEEADPDQTDLYDESRTAYTITQQPSYGN